MKRSIPTFLKNFTIIDTKEEVVSGLLETTYYIKGRCENLMEFVHCSFLEKGWSGGPETAVMVRSVQPAVIFQQVVENISELEKVA